MPGQIKVSGTWHNAKALKVKATVSGASTWHAVSSGWIKVAGTWRQWFVGAVVDTFTRTTSGTLGTSDTGNSWTSLFGTWFSNGSYKYGRKCNFHKSGKTVKVYSQTNHGASLVSHPTPHDYLKEIFQTHLIKERDEKQEELKELMRLQAVGD